MVSSEIYIKCAIRVGKNPTKVDLSQYTMCGLRPSAVYIERYHNMRKMIAERCNREAKKC